jgi:hypothetical protein
LPPCTAWLKPSGSAKWRASAPLAKAPISEEFSSHYRSAYDDFFAELGATRNSAGFFVSPIPMPEKPVASIKQGHKLRTREKRAFKLQVAADVCQLLLESR